MSHIEGLRAVSLRPNEILVGKVSISFDTRQVMDPDGARRSVGVRDANGIVRLRNRGKRAVWTPAESLKPGNHVFAVEGIISSTGRKISGGGQIPFSVVQTRARVPTTVAEPKQGTLSFDDVYKDWLAITWPYPTICQAAGNFWSTDPDNISPPSSEFVNHKGFNSLAVGNHNDAASAMSTSSVFRNPTSSHGDRELPEISANGTFVDAVNLTKSGTSMASPAVAGVAALVQSTDTTLKHWPEGCRAILLAGATRNVTDDTWWKDVASNNDARDGSGAVNALESHRIAQSRRSRNASATRRGWDVGSLRTSDFNSSTRQSTFSYKVKVPSGFFGPRKVKVALAWTSEVNVLSVFGITIPLTSQLTVDLDLKIFDSAGNQVGYSGSWDNSYEIAEFTGAPGATYTIRIRRWSGTDRVWYGIGWTVTGGLQIIRRLAGGTLLTGTRLSNAVTDLAG